MWITSMGDHVAAGVSQNVDIVVVLVVIAPKMKKNFFKQNRSIKVNNMCC